MAQLADCVSTISAKLLLPGHDYKYVLKSGKLTLVQKLVEHKEKKLKDYVNPFLNELFVEPTILSRVDERLSEEFTRLPRRNVVYMTNPFFYPR